MKDYQSMRLSFIKNNFRDTKRATAGYEEFKKLKDNTAFVSNILRNHKRNPITTATEVFFRDNLDFLISYYSILSAGIFTGYITSEIGSEAISEVIEVLEHPAVNKYFAYYYPLTLPRYLLQLLRSSDIKNYKMDSVQTVEKAFEKFMVLFHGRSIDEDIDFFLWLLDDGYQDDGTLFSLHEFISFLKEPDPILLEQNGSGYYENVNRAVLGYSKYIYFLEEMFDIITSIQDQNPLASAAIWHVESYWFMHLNEKLQGGLQGIMKILTENKLSKYLSLGAADDGAVNLGFSYMRIRKTLITAAEKTNAITDATFGRPLQILMDER